MPINPQILQLLAARLNLNASELEILQSGDYAQFFSQRIGAVPSLATDPMMIALMGSLTSQAALATATAPEGKGEEDNDNDDEPIDARFIERPADDGITSQARAALRYVAQILGACHCWGQNRDCLDCHGRGEPGYRRPNDPATFVSWVRPGLQKIGLRLTRAETFTRRHKPEN
ncbi:MAG: hypothetical protein ACRDGM_12280 [bacterium]